MLEEDRKKFQSAFTRSKDTIFFFLFIRNKIINKDRFEQLKGSSDNLSAFKYLTWQPNFYFQAHKLCTNVDLD